MSDLPRTGQIVIIITVSVLQELDFPDAQRILDLENFLEGENTMSETSLYAPDCFVFHQGFFFSNQVGLGDLSG